MHDVSFALDGRWKDRGMTLEWFREKSEWVGRDGGVPGGSDNFFADAGRLMRFCAYDYLLLGPMFFHAVIGLEGMENHESVSGPLWTSCPKRIRGPQMQQSAYTYCLHHPPPQKGESRLTP